MENISSITYSTQFQSQICFFWNNQQAVFISTTFYWFDKSFLLVIFLLMSCTMCVQMIFCQYNWKHYIYNWYTVVLDLLDVFFTSTYSSLFSTMEVKMMLSKPGLNFICANFLYGQRWVTCSGFKNLFVLTSLYKFGWEKVSK